MQCQIHCTLEDRSRQPSPALITAGLLGSGRIADDDSIELRGPGLGPAGKLFEHVFEGRFSTDGFTAQAEPPGRPCALQLSRE